VSAPLRLELGAGAALTRELNAAATWLRAHDDPSQQPDAFRLAWCCGLTFRVTAGEPYLRGDWAYYDATRAESDQQRDVARCVAEWLLRERDVTVTDFAVQYVAGELLRPRPRLVT
jgi:hypothetical protein